MWDPTEKSQRLEYNSLINFYWINPIFIRGIKSPGSRKTPLKIPFRLFGIKSRKPWKFENVWNKNHGKLRKNPIQGILILDFSEKKSIPKPPIFFQGSRESRRKWRLGFFSWIGRLVLFEVQNNIPLIIYYEFWLFIL